MWANPQELNSTVWNVFCNVASACFPGFQEPRTRGLLALRGQQEVSESTGLIMGRESMALFLRPRWQMGMGQRDHLFEANLCDTYL